MNGSLIEILVGLALLSLTLISSAMLSIYSLHTVQSAYYLTAADQQLTNMDNYLQDVHGIISQNDIDRWNKELAEQLPAGRGDLLGAYPHYRLSIYRNNTMHIL